MLDTFLASLNPMLTLFTCMIIGFALKKTNVLPESASKIMSKLIIWVFYPALSFSTMARYFTVDTIKMHASNMAMFAVGLASAIAIAFLLAPLFVKEKCYERGIYLYALTFANSGYMGDPLVQAIFGDNILSYYKMACLPLSIAIYTWGASCLVPSDKGGKGDLIKKILNPPLVAMLVGSALGIILGFVGTDGSAPTAYDAIFPSFIIQTLDSLKSCMGPTAMLLAGVTVANYSPARMFKNKKVYIATALRLIFIPSVIFAVMFGVKELINLIFGASIDNTAILLIFFAIATPLGLNTIVYPEAYGGDPEIGASMAMISHTLCVITIPIMFALLCMIFGQNTWLPLQI